MRILVFSQAAWNDSNSFGNTVTNWFDGWDDDTFYHFYTRKQLPNNRIVKEYYNISAIEVLKEIFKKNNDNKRFDRDAIENDEIIILNSDNEQRQIAKLHKHKNQLIYYIMEKVWLTEKWIDNSFMSFVDDIKPDIIFAFATNSYILSPAIDRITKKYKTKVILYLADDELESINSTAFYRRKYLRYYFNQCINAADKIYGATEEICIKYSKIYNKMFTPLYKGCSFDMDIKTKNNHPIRIVYAGNLLYGRDKVLLDLARTIRNNPSLYRKMVLEIYSNTIIDDDQKRNLYIENVSYEKGLKPYSEIKQIMNEADIVLHVESFNDESIKTVRYSFSTKIIDCLQSGSVILAIGPSSVSSIKYLKKVPGVYTVTNIDRLSEVLFKILKEDLIENARKTRMFALDNHDIDLVRNRLHTDFQNVLKKS